MKHRGFAAILKIGGNNPNIP